ncbi:MAG: ABC transporter permease [Bacteroidales bacterium]|nr:ABC transporter permease [Bacteroidales bacterium]
MKSYLKFLSRNKLFTLINIVGLCLSMAFLLLLGDLIYRQTSVENYQTRGERTFVLGNERFMMSHFRIGQRLQDRFPEIEDWCSISGYDINFTINGQEVVTKMLVTPSNFFEFFDYRLLTGDKSQVLSAPNQIVVSKAFAQRYWPEGDAVGRELVLGDDDLPDGHITYTVSGVMEDFDRSVIPAGHECVVNIENLRSLHSSAYTENLTNAGSCVLFLMEREGSDLRSKTDEMRDYLKTFFWLYQIEAVKELTLTTFSSIYYDDRNCSMMSGDLNHGSRSMTQLYVIIALLVLVFAIFNYVNLSVSLTTDRSKEMATRRLLGLSRLQVFLKLIGESILFTAIAFVIAYFIALALQGKAIEMANCPLDLRKDTSFVTILIFLLAIGLTGLLAGFVPASVLSGYQPIDIVRGTFRRRVRQRWSHVLMVLQSVFAILMLTITLLLGSGIRQRMTQPLGYDIEGVLETWGAMNFDQTQRQTMRDRLLKFPEVEAVGYGFGTPIEYLENQTTTSTDGDVVSLRLLMGDSCFFNILNIHPEKIYSDDKNSVGVNHQTLRQFGKKDTDTEFAVAGSENSTRVKALYPDIVYLTVMNEEQFPTPFLFFKTDEYRDDDDNYVRNNYGKPRQLLVKYHGERKRVEAEVKRLLAELSGSEAAEVHALTDLHKKWYADYERFLRVLTIFTIVAMLIAVLGLMAMNSYFVSQRRREIAVRRVFGAEVSSITLRLLRTVAIQSLIAAIIAVPLSFWLAPKVGSISGLNTPMEIMPLLIALLIVLSVGILTAALQGWRAATENPINSIKTE